VGVEGMQRQDYPNAIDLTDTVVSIWWNDFYFKMQSTWLWSTGSLTNYVISWLSWDTTV
jgi:hypothetical protein